MKAYAAISTVAPEHRSPTPTLNTHPPNPTLSTHPSLMQGAARNDSTDCKMMPRSA